ncbi:uncharacterized protein [Palaemon carinicauda]|uniref:uncharacterized protein n=1 Tax=Palaemon carinicauda TaxID=392227 RepID=UPI0035B645BE
MPLIFLLKRSPHPSQPADAVDEALDEPMDAEGILADVSPPNPTLPLGPRPDHPHRLIQSESMMVDGVEVIHKHVKIECARQQRKCRLYSRNGICRDTVYQCLHCKIALCHVTGQSFAKYHTLYQYWTPGRRGEGPGRCRRVIRHRGPSSSAYLKDPSQLERIFTTIRRMRINRPGVYITHRGPSSAGFLQDSFEGERILTTVQRIRINGVNTSSVRPPTRF